MLTKVQELKLVARCVAFDDRDAFGRLVNEYREPLCRFLLNMTGGDASLTDDLAQEAFLKAWLSIRSFKGVAKFKTWLFKIAYNEFVSHKRADKEGLTEELESVADTTIVNDSPDMAMDVREAIARLPEKERTVVLLFYLEGLPIKKVVEITGYPEGTVKVYLSRARKKMEIFLK